VIRRPCKQPYQDIGPEVRPEEHLTSYLIVEKEENDAKKKQRNGIGNQMEDIAMNQRGHEYSYQSMKCSRYNSKYAKWQSEHYFRIEGCPHEKHEAKWNY
jgi:hypothetical protein